MPNGDALVADAAGNDIIRVTPDGDATTVARFDLEVVSTDTCRRSSGLPPEMPAEAVPTSVDDRARRGDLRRRAEGLPVPARHVEGVAHRAGRRRRVVLGEHARPPTARCTRTASRRSRTSTSTTRNGRLFVLELAEDGVLAFEAGFETGEFPPAVLLEIRDVGRWNERALQLAEGQLSQPGGVAIGPDGKRVRHRRACSPAAACVRTVDAAILDRASGPPAAAAPATLRTCVRRESARHRSRADAVRLRRRRRRRATHAVALGVIRTPASAAAAAATGRAPRRDRRADRRVPARRGGRRARLLPGQRAHGDERRPGQRAGARRGRGRRVRGRPVQPEPGEGRRRRLGRGDEGAGAADGPGAPPTRSSAAAGRRRRRRRAGAVPPRHRRRCGPRRRRPSGVHA